MKILGTDELEIQFAILELMTNGKVWTNADLKSKLRSALPLTAEDKTASPTRPNEEVWENRVNNALSPSRASSLYRKGHVENAGRGAHRITDAGRRFINEDDFDLTDIKLSIPKR